MDSKLRDRRRQQAFALVMIGSAITAGVGWMLGPMVFALAVIALPIPAFLLLFSADVLRYDERQENQGRVREPEAAVLPRREARAS